MTTNKLTPLLSEGFMELFFKRLKLPCNRDNAEEFVKDFQSRLSIDVKADLSFRSFFFGKTEVLTVSIGELGCEFHRDIFVVRHSVIKKTEWRYIKFWKIQKK